MFALGKSNKSSSLTAIVPGQKGFAIARIERHSEGRPLLQACELEPLAKHSNVDPGGRLKGHDLDKHSCATVLPVGDYKLLVIDAPDVPASELRAAIRWRIQDMINFSTDDAVIDVFDAPPGSPAGTEKQLYVVVAHADTVKRRIEQLELAGANLEIIDIPEMAIRNITACLPEDESGIAMLHFEEEQCLITITHQSCLYLTRTIEIGYQHLQAAAYDPLPVLDRLALEIQRSMDYYEHHFQQPPIRALGILPLPVPDHGLTNALQDSLGLAVRIITIDEIVENHIGVGTEISADCLLAIGAALRVETRTL